MSGHSFDMNAYIDPIRSRTVPGVVRGAALAAVGAGVLGFGYGMVASPVWAWGAMLVAIVWTLGLAQGGVMFSVVSTLTWARWSRPLKRIAEVYAFALPLVWLAQRQWQAHCVGGAPGYTHGCVSDGMGGRRRTGPHRRHTLQPMWVTPPGRAGGVRLRVAAMLPLFGSQHGHPPW